MNTNAYMSFLPNEVILQILEDKNLSIEDVMKFSFSSKRMADTVLNDNILWRKKLFQRWPCLEKIILENNYKADNYLSEIKIIFASKLLLMDILSSMSEKFFTYYELSEGDFAILKDIINNSHPLLLYFFQMELISLINQPDRHVNMTIKYYACKMMRFVRHTLLKKEWINLIKLPKENQILERTIIFLEQWCVPETYVTYEVVEEMFMSITDKVKEVLKIRNESHPIFTAPKEKLLDCRSAEISADLWSPEDSKNIFLSVWEVMYGDPNFRNFRLKGSFLFDQVFQTVDDIRGIQLAIIFKIICRRLGVKCDFIIYNYDQLLIDITPEYLIRWRNESSPSDKILHVRPKNYILEEVDECDKTAYNNTYIIDVLLHEIVFGRRIAFYDKTNPIARSGVEFMFMQTPLDSDSLYYIMRTYEWNRLNLSYLREKFVKMTKDKTLNIYYRKQIKKELRFLAKHQKEVNKERRNFEIPRKRTSEVAFAVGLIVECNKYKEATSALSVMRSMCQDIENLDQFVIIGWSTRFVSETGYTYTKLCYHHDRHDQPFYQVLSSYGSFVLPQDSLILATNPQPIDNPNMGKFFDNFGNTHYVPNEEFIQQYPDDEEVRNEFIEKYYKQKLTMDVS